MEIRRDWQKAASGIQYLDKKLGIIGTPKSLVAYIQGLGGKEFVTQTLKRRRLTVLSQLWIFGCYEILRTLHEKLKEDPEMKEIEPEIQEAKQSFNRIRIPLAKMEAASKHENEDYPIPLPGYSESSGMVWMVNDGGFISRDLLAYVFCNALKLLDDRIKKSR